MPLTPIKRMDKPTKACRTIAKAALHAGLWDVTVIKAHGGYYVITHLKLRSSPTGFVGFYFTVAQAQKHLPRMVEKRDTDPNEPMNRLDWFAMDVLYGSFTTSRVDDPDFLLRS